MNYKLIEVERFPSTFEKGILYWSREFEISAHVCACGCGDIIYLPITPVDYSLTVDKNGPTLRPSIGNWGVCNAHYFIRDGKVAWAKPWTKKEISTGRAQEDKRRQVFFNKPRVSWYKKLISYIPKLFRFISSKYTG